MNEYTDLKVERIKERNYKSERRRYSEEEAKYEYYPRELFAGFWHRFFAFLVDASIAKAIVSIVLGILVGFTGFETSEKIYRLLSTLITLLYFTLSTYFTGGQTLGKMIFALKVVRLDGGKLDFVTVFIREFIGRYIHTYGILAILYILVGLTEKKQSLSDLFADTSVISLAKENAYIAGAESMSSELIKEY